MMQFDLTRPNTGRMLDYWLGGTHNFEIDRQLAEQVSKNFPVVKPLTEESRQLVTLCVKEYYACGIRALIDFGSSLPTCDNTHIVAHKLDSEIRVVYSDIDPITVAYGQDLLQNERNVIFLQADAVDPHNVLDAPLTRELLGNERRVGFLYLSLAHTMNDDQVRASWRALYDWAAPGSQLAVSVASDNWNYEPDLVAVTESYRRANIQSYFRTPAQLAELIKPWKLSAEGVLPSTEWNITRSEKPTRVVAYLVRASK